jgi:hypothetical protein
LLLDVWTPITARWKISPAVSKRLSREISIRKLVQSSTGTVLVAVLLHDNPKKYADIIHAPQISTFGKTQLTIHLSFTGRNAYICT